MSGIWLTGLILLPLLIGSTLLGALLFAPGRRVDESPIAGRHVALTATGLATVCAAALALNGDQEVPFRLTWLPGAGAMTFSLGTTGLYAALATTSAAFLALLLSRLPSRESSRPVYRLPSPGTSASGLLLLTLAAANTAFLSGHFLGRYVALEIAGVCIALVPLLTLARDTGPRLGKFVYLVLRVGDTGFLISMLILTNAAGTLNIGPALESGASLDAPHLTWVIIGFVLAVWVKIGAWPFESWQQIGDQFDSTSHGWTYATVMPNLGLYLLYRITPLLALQPALQTWALWLSLSGMVLVTVIALLKRDLRPAVVYLNAAQGGLALCLAAGGLQKSIVTLMLVMTPLRLLFLWGSNAMQTESLRVRRLGGLLVGVGSSLLMGFNGYLVWQLAQSMAVSWTALILLALIVILMSGRYLAAAMFSKPDRFQKTYQVWEPEIPSQVATLDRGLLKLAEALRAWFEVGFLERVVTWTPRVFVGIAELLHQTIEQQGLEGILRSTAKGVFVFSRWMQERHTGRLRANLQWVFVALLVITAILVWQGW
ncbi:MAG: hypothetical protein JXR84_11005 [Anaerolineae bacterium]|nr:hypothetical protein [Anaerolineae bacterium]